MTGEIINAEVRARLTTFGKGINKLIRPTWMLALSQLCLASIPLTSFFMSASKSYYSLVVTGLGIIFCNMTGLSIILALAVACEELSLDRAKFSDAVILFQKGLYSCLLILSFVAWALWMNGGSILSVIGLDEHITRYIEEFTFSFLPGYLLFVICIFLQKFMYITNMDKLWPSLCCHFVVAVAQPILTFVFISPLDLCLRGTAYSLTLSYFNLAFLLFLCFLWEGEFRTAWPGWSWECVKDHWPYFKCVAPYIIVLALEWWTLYFGTFIVGSLNRLELPTQLIVVLSLEFLCLVTHQFALAASAQVYDAVKGGFWKRAVMILKLSMFLTWVFSIVCGACLSGLKSYLGTPSSPDWRIVMSTAEIIILIAPLPFLRGTQALGFHVLRRLEQKKLPVIIAAVGYWGISFPVALLLMYYFKRGIQGTGHDLSRNSKVINHSLRRAYVPMFLGFWMGYTIGSVIQAFVFLVLLYREMRKWIDRQTYKRQKPAAQEPVTPSGQVDLTDPFLADDAEDGAKRCSILWERSRIHVPFDATDSGVEAGASTTQQETAEEDPRPSIRVIAFRTLEFMAAVFLFCIGIGFRFFVPSAHAGHNHDF